MLFCLCPFSAYAKELSPIGTQNHITYRNEYFGIQAKFADGWKLFPDEALLTLSATDENVNSLDEQLKISGFVFDLIATGNDNDDLLTLLILNIDSFEDPDTLFFDTVNTWASGKENPIQTSKESFSFLNEPRLSCTSNYFAQGYHIYLRGVQLLAGDYMAVLLATSPDPDRTDSILGYFEILDSGSQDTLGYVAGNHYENSLLNLSINLEENWIALDPITAYSGEETLLEELDRSGGPATVFYAMTFEYDILSIDFCVPSDSSMSIEEYALEYENRAFPNRSVESGLFPLAGEEYFSFLIDLGEDSPISYERIVLVPAGDYVAHIQVMSNNPDLLNSTLGLFQPLNTVGSNSVTAEETAIIPDDPDTWKDIVQLIGCEYASTSYLLGLRSDGTVLHTLPFKAESFLDTATADELEDIEYLQDAQEQVLAAFSALDTWTDIRVLACDGLHVAGIKTDGTVISNTNADLSDWKRMIKVVIGKECIAGLCSDGTVRITRKHEIKEKSEWDTWFDVSGWHDVVDIYAFNNWNENGLVGLTADGRVYSTISEVLPDDYGYLEPDAFDYLSKWKNIASVCCSVSSIYGIKEDGSVVVPPWEKSREYYGYGSSPSTWTGIEKLIPGYEGDLFGIRKSGEVVASIEWGYELMLEDILDWSDISALSVGYDYALGITNTGTVKYWVPTYHESLSESIDLSLLDDWNNITCICPTYYFIAGLKNDGTVVVITATDLL